MRMFNSQLNAADEKGKEMFSSILLFVKQITSLLAEDGIGVTAFPTCNLYSARIFTFINFGGGSRILATLQIYLNRFPYFSKAQL